MLKQYLQDRVWYYRSTGSTIPTSPEGKNARLVWNHIRNLFITKQENDFDNPIALYLTFLEDGHFYYSEGIFFDRIAKRGFSSPEATCKIILKLANDDGINVNRLENKSISIFDSRHLSIHKNKLVYEFLYTPPCIVKI